MSDALYYLGVKLLIFLSFIRSVSTYEDCGDGTYCTGAGTYCCGTSCCSSVWTLWWFWTVFIGIFCVVGICTYLCRRYYTTRRYTQPRYLVVQDTTAVLTAGPGSAYQTYGTVPVATAPPQPPPYTGSKPPGYTP